MSFVSSIAGMLEGLVEYRESGTFDSSPNTVHSTICKEESTSKGAAKQCKRKRKGKEEARTEQRTESGAGVT